MPSLVFTQIGSSDFTAPLHEGLIVGSGDASSLQVEHRDIAPCHAEFFVNPKDGAWWVRDLESATGTFVNGVRVKSVRLHHDDKIAFGPIVARLEHPEETPHKNTTDNKAEPPKPEMAKPELAKPEAAKPEVAKPGAAGPEKSKPAGTKSEEAMRAKVLEEVQSLEKAIRGHQIEQDALKAAIAGLAKERADAESILQERVAELAKATGALKQAEEQRAQVAADVELLSESYRTLKAERATLEPAIAGHKTEHGRLFTLVADLTSRHSAADAAFKAAEQRRAQLVGEIGELEKSQAALTADLKERGANLQDHDKALAIAAKEFKQVEAKRGIVLAEVEALKKALGGHHIEQGALKAAITGLATRKADTESILQERVAELARATEALKQAEEQRARLMADVESLSGRRETLKAEHAAAVAKCDETLKKTEAQRTEAQKELDRSRNEQLKLATETKRLQAAVEGRKVEDERLREVLRTYEARSAEVAASVKAQEAELRERVSACGRADQSLRQAKEQHALLLDEIDQFESQIHLLKGESEGLEEQRASLQEEKAHLETTLAGQQDKNRELQTKHAEALSAFTEQKARLDAVTASLADLQSQHVKLQGELATATATHKTLQAESEKHSATATAAQAETTRCRAEFARLTAVAQSARKEIDSLSNRNIELTALMRDLETGVAATSERLAALSGTEERLQQARAEFEEIRRQHTTLTDEVARLGAERDATRERSLSLEEEIARMEHDRLRLEGQIDDVRTRHQEIVRSFEQYQDESNHARRLLGAEIAKLEAQSTNAHSRHESVLEKIEEAQRRQMELVEQNRRVEAALRQYHQLEEDIRNSEAAAKALENRRQTLEGACAGAQERIEEYNESLNAHREEMKQLEDARARLKKEVAVLTDAEKQQRARFDELQSLNKDAEQLALDQRSQHEESIHNLGVEVLMLEARLTRARAWSEELDQLYGQLASLPEKSPEAREHWEKIQKRKQAMVTEISEESPARPRGRGTTPSRNWW